MDESQDLTQNKVERASRMLEMHQIYESPRSLPTASPTVTDANNLTFLKSFGQREAW